MKLKDWMSKKRVSGVEFARRLGVAKATVSRYVTEDRVPRPAILRKIHDETNGEVSAPDFMFCHEAESAGVGKAQV
jgi:transcriptional regulator with XRE-family HTH domain